MRRLLWLDYLRAFACFLVAVGHLFMSVDEANLVQDNLLLEGFIQVIYHFHVPLFFFSSGYLFQTVYSRCSNWKEYAVKKSIRLFDMLIPYVIFSFITYIMKVLLSNEVNTAVSDSFITVLIHAPIGQMWYLYAAAMVGLFTPLMRCGRSFYGIIGVSMILKILSNFPALHVFTGATYVMQNQIWYVIGMAWAYKGLKSNWTVTGLAIAGFSALCMAEFIVGSLPSALNDVITFSGVLACVGVFQALTQKKARMPFVWHTLSRYMLQIYLLHTIFAAGIRILLLRLGITNVPVHIVFGLLFSFAGPVFCAWMAERIRILSVVFFPSRTIRSYAESGN